MAKQTDLEKRLDALEARQNMFFGGIVPDLSNIPNLPNVPNLAQTGAKPPAPVTMNQPKTRPPSEVQNNKGAGATGATPTYNLGNLGFGLGNIDLSQIPGLDLSQLTGT